MVKIGLEIHGYLDVKEKLFCDCPCIHGAKLTKPNVNVCPVCTAQPGSKPMLPNKNALDKTIQTALILNCEINRKLVWQRKHYDWPDLPKGYQNTISGAHASPVGENGKFSGIRIKEVHLEEDPAAWNPETGETDYNKSGSPLVEMVTEPDFTSAERVSEWLKQLIITLSYVKSIDKKSGLKADVNVSLPEKNGKRVEIKNVNSIKNVKKAIEFETQRQEKETLEKQETRAFSELKGTTIKMREKTGAEDYRFISDPDLPIITIKKERTEKIKKALPETPREKLNRLVKKHGIDKKHAEILTKKLEVAELFEKTIKQTPPKLATQWVTEELLSVLNHNKKELEEINLKTEHFIELLKLVENKTLTKLKAQEILRKFVPASFSPKEEAKKHETITSPTEIENACREILQKNQKAAEDYKKGNQNALNFLIGQVMKQSNKRADYKTTKKTLAELLN